MYNNSQVIPHWISIDLRPHNKNTLKINWHFFPPSILEKIVQCIEEICTQQQKQPEHLHDIVYIPDDIFLRNTKTTTNSNSTAHKHQLLNYIFLENQYMISFSNNNSAILKKFQISNQKELLCKNSFYKMNISFSHI